MISDGKGLVTCLELPAVQDLLGRPGDRRPERTVERDSDQQAEAILRSVPEVESYSRRTGARLLQVAEGLEPVGLKGASELDHHR